MHNKTQAIEHQCVGPGGIIPNLFHCVVKRFLEEVLYSLDNMHLLGERSRTFTTFSTIAHDSQQQQIGRTAY